MFKKAQAEINKISLYIILSTVIILCSYSVYLFCSDSTIENIKDENHFFEVGTAILLFIAMILFFLTFTTSKNIFILLVSIILLFGAGEEINWGQQLFEFKTPQKMIEVNVQKEFNVHNIEIFNTNNFDKTHKKGWNRLLEINFLYRLFIMTFGIIIPVLSASVRNADRILKKIKFPIVPISIGIFFLVSWLFFEFTVQNLPKGKSEDYYASAQEIFEFLTAFIFAEIGYYFYSTKRFNV